MDRLFELCAELTLDTAAFIRSVNEAENTARQMQALLDRSNAQTAAGLTALQGTASGVWRNIAGSIQAAINKTHEFLNIRGAQQITVAVRTEQSSAGPQESAHRATVDSSAQWAGALARVLGDLALEMDGETVGRLSAGSASEKISREARQRRFNP